MAEEVKPREEIRIPGDINCIWVGDDLFGRDDDHRQGVGRCGYWFDHYIIPAKDDKPEFDRIVQKPDRRPIWVLCPAWYRDGELIGTPFCIDYLSTAKNEPWDLVVDLSSLVIGQKPNITVHPSIHLIGIWHGWLQNGVIKQA